MANKALIIGIDDYPNAKLNACVNDARRVASLLETNSDGSLNFDVSLLLNESATRAKIRKNIRELFKSDNDIALLYFSGHGVDDSNDGFIVSYDYQIDDYGISMPEIMKFVNKSKAKNKVVIFDCCYAGFAGTSGLIGDDSIIGEGTIILTASRKNETSSIEPGDDNSLFTKLFIEALRGGASDLFGNTTPSSIYAFIDKALGSWEQRPVFKSNVVSFVSLRKNEEIIKISEMKKITSIFKNRDACLSLDPSYEVTNFEGSIDRNYPPYRDESHCKVMKLLQLYNRNGLVIPVGEDSMYEAAMKSKGCKLTMMGQYYYDLVKKKRI